MQTMNVPKEAIIKAGETFNKTVLRAGVKVRANNTLADELPIWYQCVQ